MPLPVILQLSEKLLLASLPDEVLPEDFTGHSRHFELHIVCCREHIPMVRDYLHELLC